MIEQQAIYTSGAGAPWWAVLAIVMAPGLFAVALTMAAVIMVRRVNRNAGNDELRALTIVKWTVGLGALFGPLCQWGFQKLVQYLVGAPTHLELIVVAPFVTGVAAMIAYDVLRWQSKTRWPGLYALISVKHSSERGHVGDTPDGDLTRVDPP